MNPSGIGYSDMREERQRPALAERQSFRAQVQRGDRDLKALNSTQGIQC